MPFMLTTCARNKRSECANPFGIQSFREASSFLYRKDTPDEITANDQALAAQTSLLYQYI